VQVGVGVQTQIRLVVLSQGRDERHFRQRDSAERRRGGTGAGGVHDAGDQGGVGDAQVRPGRQEEHTQRTRHGHLPRAPLAVQGLLRRTHPPGCARLPRTRLAARQNTRRNQHAHRRLQKPLRKFVSLLQNETRRGREGHEGSGAGIE